MASSAANRLSFFSFHSASLLSSIPNAALRTVVSRSRRLSSVESSVGERVGLTNRPRLVVRLLRRDKFICVLLGDDLLGDGLGYDLLGDGLGNDLLGDGLGNDLLGDGLPVAAGTPRIKFVRGCFCDRLPIRTWSCGVDDVSPGEAGARAPFDGVTAVGMLVECDSRAAGTSTRIPPGCPKHGWVGARRVAMQKSKTTARNFRGGQLSPPQKSSLRKRNSFGKKSRQRLRLRT